MQNRLTRNPKKYQPFDTKSFLNPQGEFWVWVGRTGIHVMVDFLTTRQDDWLLPHLQFASPVQFIQIPPHRSLFNKADPFDHGVDIRGLESFACSGSVSIEEVRSRSRRRPLSATQHHPTPSLIDISWHCNEP